ncbi:MAG: trehalase-like domain-containing protein, partial [Pseudomonadales bacterium]
MKNLDYGVIGNGQSAALVASDGSIDWCCLPAFDSPSVFAKLLDKTRGGSFAISMPGQTTVTQQYLARTNILITTLSNGEDVVEVVDFMPRYRTTAGGYHCPPDLLRYIRPVSGKPRLHINYQPKLGYAKGETLTEVSTNYLKSSAQQPTYESLYLYSNLNLDTLQAGGSVTIERDAYLWLSYNEKIVAPHIQQVRLEFERTKVYWLNWVAEARRFERWNEEIERSVLVLKLLAYQRT